MERETRNHCRMRHATGISPQAHVQWKYTISAGERGSMRHLGKFLTCSALLLTAAALLLGPQFASSQAPPVPGMQHVEIAFSGFREEELSGQDLAGGIILHAKQGEARTAACEPVVRAAVELHEFAFASHTQTALAMSGRTALARGAVAFLAQEAAQGFATERKAFDLVELFAKVVVVEPSIFGAIQAQDRLTSALGQAARAGPAAVGVSQRRLPVFAQTPFQALNLAHAQAQEFGGAGTRHGSLDASGNYAHSLKFLLTQRECLLSHRVTFSRCR